MILISYCFCGSILKIHFCLYAEDSYKSRNSQGQVLFQYLAITMGVNVMNYHADDGRFTGNGFIQDCKIKNQGISYYGVNAHFQNGIAEKKIRD